MLLRLIGVTLIALTSANASPPQKAAPSAAPAMTNSLAPYELRRKNAETVKVITSILGIELGMTIEKAHAKLDKLSDPAHLPKEEGGKGDAEEGGEGKILWQLTKTDYRAVFVKADEQGRIIYLQGLLRTGKELPFDKIGELRKAPLKDRDSIVWDVLRPNQPLFRVIASGKDRKASTITIFSIDRSRI